MYKDKMGELVYSPTDLIRFMESPFASWMERLYLEDKNAATPDAKTDEATLVAATGDKHEADFLASLKAQGKKIVEIDKKDPEAEQKTTAALKTGAEIVYQGCLRLGSFRGFTDFLVRDAEAKEILYEIWDTKLARKPKPYYLVQLCCYAEMLAVTLGVRPSKLRVVLGTLEIPAFNTADFFHYYVGLKRAFLEQMAAFDPTKPPEPDPRADHGRWVSHAEDRLKAADHLVRVANITVGQIKKLQAAGVTTMQQLAAFKGKVDGLADDAVAGLVEQAQLQITTELKRKSAKPGEIVPAYYRVLANKAGSRRGLELLPPPSAGDVYFDMEGYPLLGLGLEYLFGAVTRDGGKLQFHDWWAHDTREEKVAFEGFLDWAYKRWKDDPGMHIYHYAAYEVSALRKLMGKHGTHEDQVDELLRGNVFVDLYQVLKQGLRVGEESYSIKYIEHLYRPARAGSVATAGQSIVEYARWIESGEPREWQKSKRLKGIRDYNQDDCESTVQLADWLRAQQTKAGIKYVAAATAKAPAKADPAKDADKAAAFAELQRLIVSLDQKAQAEKSADNKAIHTVYRDLVGFHRREEKPVWWRMFDRALMTHQELKDDIACIGEATLQSAQGTKVAKSLAFDYQFDPTQDVKLKVEDKVMPVENFDVKFEILDLNEEGALRLKVGGPTLKKLNDAMPALTSFIPVEVISSEVLRDALHEIITQWEQKGIISSALLQFLLRQPPAIAGVKPGMPLQNPGENAGDAAVRLVAGMNGSTLCLQGPPGTGKTYTASRMIEALLKQGKRVGVTSNSHKAIVNLLRACNDQMGGTLQGIKVGDSAEDPFFAEAPKMVHIESSSGALGSYAAGVVSGTAWLFTRPEWIGQLDYLFVDEAGQMCLANLVAVSRATKNIVLLGDQMQLEQPIQGSHPGESGSSALGYYLNGHSTIPETLGLFLPESRRMHSAICGFISDLAYEGRLKAAQGNDTQRLLPLPGGTHPLDMLAAGVVFEPVVHDGNVQGSDEEADRIRDLANRLIGRGFFDRDGKSRKLGWNDILFVSPYNMQVRKIRERLPDGARVGSVDKFQGQEAPVVFVSMCSSFGEYGSRGIEFILDQNRMNVAISRAQVLAVVVGDPRIAQTAATNIEGMRRLNLYCRLVQECQKTA